MGQGAESLEFQNEGISFEDVLEEYIENLSATIEVLKQRYSANKIASVGTQIVCSDMPGFTEISKTDFFDKFRLDFMNLLERKIESKERSMSFERIQNGSGYDYTDEYYFELQKETELLREIEFKLDEL